MSGTAALLFLFAAEIGYTVYGCMKQEGTKKIRNMIWMGVFVLALLLMVTGVMPFDIRWGFLLIILLIKGIVSLVSWIGIRKGKREDIRGKNAGLIARGIMNLILIGAACVPAFFFIDYKAIPTDGPHTFETVSETWVDTSRMETLADTGEHRKVTVQFWYPGNNTTGETYPLVIFSHGAYGYRGSNQSLYEELASNGYVVCSIEHTYQAIFSQQADGTIVTVNPAFLEEVSKTNADTTEEEDLKITSKWMEIRTGDMNFVLDTIKDKCAGNMEGEELTKLYQEINTEKIALTGHSLGGATAAELGRNRTDITAVVDIDGSMLGDILSAKGNEVTIDPEPYPIPILNIYSQYHYEESRKMADKYMNTLATKNGVDGMETVILGAQHLNYTDLPLFSPGLAKLMGVQGIGKVNPRACIQLMDEIILNYCNHYLKGTEALSIEKEYSIE